MRAATLTGSFRWSTLIGRITTMKTAHARILFVGWYEGARRDIGRWLVMRVIVLPWKSLDVAENTWDRVANLHPPVSWPFSPQSLVVYWFVYRGVITVILGPLLSENAYELVAVLDFVFLSQLVDAIKRGFPWPFIPILAVDCCHTSLKVCFSFIGSGLSWQHGCFRLKFLHLYDLFLQAIFDCIFFFVVWPNDGLGSW